MYKQKLTLLERILFPQIIPQNGDYVGNIVAENLSDKLQVTQAEFDLYEVTQLPNGRLNWNEQGTKAVFEIELTERENKMFKEALENHIASKSLPRSLNKLYEAVCKPELPEDLKPSKKDAE